MGSEEVEKKQDAQWQELEEEKDTDHHKACSPLLLQLDPLLKRGRRKLLSEEEGSVVLDLCHL